MDRVDIEMLVVRLIDRMVREGAAATYDVDEPTALRELLWHEAHRRGIDVRTGTFSADENSVWVYSPTKGRPSVPWFR